MCSEREAVITGVLDACREQEAPAGGREEGKRPGSLGATFGAGAENGPGAAGGAWPLLCDDHRAPQRAVVRLHQIPTPNVSVRQAQEQKQGTMSWGFSKRSCQE